MDHVLRLILLGLISFSSIALPPTQPSTEPITTQPASSVDEGDFAPMLFLMLLLALAVIVVAAVILVGVSVLLAALLLLGVISSSLLIGIAHRRAAPALRALIFQLAALLGILVGGGIFGASSVWLHWRLHPLGAIGIGASTGMLLGLGIAAVVIRVFSYFIELMRRGKV